MDAVTGHGLEITPSPSFRNTEGGVCVCVSQWLFKHIPYVLCYFCRILHLKNAVSHNAICMVIHFDGQMKQYQM